MRKIKLPFVSRKKYENAKRNLKQMAEARQQLENAFVENQKKYLVACENFKALQDTNREIGNRMEFMACQIDDLKKENKKLKTLLTKNGIKYKKEK